MGIGGQVSPILAAALTLCLSASWRDLAALCREQNAGLGRLSQHGSHADRLLHISTLSTFQAPKQGLLHVQKVNQLVDYENNYTGTSTLSSQTCWIICKTAYKIES